MIANLRNRGSMLVLVLFLCGLLSVFAAVAAMACAPAGGVPGGAAEGPGAGRAAGTPCGGVFDVNGLAAPPPRGSSAPHPKQNL